MPESILQNIETALNNLSLRYVTFTEDTSKTPNELKDFDIELNDSMDRYVNGEHLEWVSFMLRHKDTSLTLRKYYKYMPNKQEERVIINFDTVAKKRHS